MYYLCYYWEGGRDGRKEGGTDGGKGRERGRGGGGGKFLVRGRHEGRREEEGGRGREDGAESEGCLQSKTQAKI